MHRIDEIGNIDNLFVTGNPAIGQIATRMGADLPNALQEELCSVIEGAGITLEKGTNDQLLQAIQILGGGPGASLPNPYGLDDQNPAEDDADRQTIVFEAGKDCVTWNSITLWRSGVSWRVALELMTSGASITALDLRIAYLAVADGTANPVVKKRWQAGKAYVAGDMIIPPLASLNGKYYVCSTAGTSGASAPTFGTVDDGYTNDGATLVWQCKAGGFKLLSSLPVPPGTAWQDFAFDDEDLTIPQADASANARLHLGIIRRGLSDGNPNHLHHVEARVYPLEV